MPLRQAQGDTPEVQGDILVAQVDILVAQGDTLVAQGEMCLCAEAAAKVEKKAEPTVGFTVWPVLLTLEGPTSMIGIVLSAVYGDTKIPKTDWHCEHKFVSRAEFAAHLIGGGKEVRRLGVGAKTSDVAEKIRAKAEASGVKCAIFRGVTDSMQK